jgi:DNA invertase Pin-like site-specific DNA recombinase
MTALSKETIAKFVVAQAPTPKSKRKRLTEDQENRIVALRKKGFQWAEIGRKLGFSQYTVQKAHDRVTAPGYQRFEVAKEELKRMRDLRKEGKTFREIARIVKRSLFFVHKHI